MQFTLTMGSFKNGNAKHISTRGGGEGSFNEESKCNLRHEKEPKNFPGFANCTRCFYMFRELILFYIEKLSLSDMLNLGCLYQIKFPHDRPR